MKRLLIALMVLGCAVSADAKILGLTTDISTGQHGDGQFIQNSIYLYCNILGIEVDYVLMADTVRVAAALASGDYSKAVTVNLTNMTADYDTEAELAAVGWTHLAHYIDPNSAMAQTVTPIVILPPGTISPTGDFAAAYTGCLAVSSGGNDAYAGMETATDSVYMNMHHDTRSWARVIETDSVATIYPLVWVGDGRMDSYNQKHAILWKTQQTNGHAVYYFPYSHSSSFAGLLCAVLAIGETVTPIEVPTILMEYGYYSSGFVADSTGQASGLATLMDTMISYGAKLDIVINTYYWEKGQALDDVYTFVAPRVAAYPDNIRFTHSTFDDWITHTDWFSGLADRTQAQITGYINNSQDSTALAAYMGSTISSTRACAYSGNLNGRLAAGGDWYDVWKSFPDAGLTEIITWGGAQHNMDSGLLNSVHTWLPKTDGTLIETEIYTFAGQMKITAGYGAHVDTMQTVRASAYKGVYNAWWLKNTLGGYIYNSEQRSISSSDWTKEVARRGSYQPGYGHMPAMLNGGAAAPTNNNFLHVVRDVDAQMDILNTIACQTVIKYAWIDEVKWDRKTGRKWPNSHVTRD